jgi:PTS system mannose-specific IIA component
MADKNKQKQVGVVLVTHTDYGARLLKAAEFILGPQESCTSVSVDGTHEVEQTVKALKKTVAQCDGGRGVLLLTDMFGGTPTNLSLSLLGSGELEVVTGVNLPMLLKVLGARELPLAQLATEAKNAGCQGIVVAGELLRSKVGGE